MSEERLKSITSSSHLAPDEVARHTFGSVRRGFDPNEVRAYLESLAVGLRGLADREDQLFQKLAEAEHLAANPVLDEPALTAALGTETARVLHSAHEAAAELVAKADAEASRLLGEAREAIERDRLETETRLTEQTAAAEASVGEFRDRTNQQMAAGLEAARAEADQLLEQAREQCRAMVDEAQGLRARVLADLARRRKVLHAQIEQLRAGRERLTETVEGVRRSVDTIAEELFAAEDNARLAAEAAGREVAGRPDDATPEEMAALLLAEEAAADHELVPTDPATAAVPESGETDDGGSANDEATVEVPAGGLEDSPVDALFAKIRAARDEPEPVPEPEPETPPAAVPAEAAGGSGDGEPGSPGDRGATDATDTDTGSDRDDDDDDDDDDGDLPPDEQNAFALRRDELIAPVVTTLARRLKRTLQDSQNELLDSLRSQGSRWSAEVLPQETEHVDGYATAALPALEEAAEAGVAFAGTGTSGGPRTDVLVGMAHELADAVIGPLRRRLLDDPSSLEGADESVVVEHVGSAFHEWKGERIERLAGDHVVAAFSAGTIAALEGSELEWVAVASNGDAPCPDCEDNGLNGSQQPGEEFPTGHRHPPAHPGCRCLLAPSAT